MTFSKELNERSPLRVLDRSIHGGLGQGNLGVVCSGPGAGKTAMLVGVCLDHLMRGHQVLHVALDQPVDRVRNYYDEIFAELARSEKLEDAPAVRLGIERRRFILTYQDHSFRVEALRRALSFLREHAGLDPDVIVVDGYVWGEAVRDDLAALKAIAGEQEAELWMSAAIDGQAPVTHPRGYPDPVSMYEDLVDVLVRLKGTENGTVQIRLLKDHDHPEPGPVGLELDPTTLLLVTR